MKSPLRIQNGGAEFLSMQNIEYIYQNYVKATLQESVRLLPDSVVFGAFFLALLTQSYSMTIFAVSLIEASLLGLGIRNFFTYADLFHTAPSTTDNRAVCYSGYYTPTLETLLGFGPGSITSAFPSFPVFLLATASSYVVGTMLDQQKELEALGANYSSRFYIALFAVFFFLSVITMYRLVYACEGLGVLLASVLLGLLIGAGLVFQNIRLLGRDSTNLVGIPLLRERTRDGKPLYVCPQQTSNTSP